LAARYREKKTRWFRVKSAIFRFTRRVLAFFRVNPATSFNSTQFLYPERLFLSNVGSTSGKPGETGKGGGGFEKNRNIGEFSFRGILQPTTATIRFSTLPLRKIP